MSRKETLKQIRSIEKLIKKISKHRTKYPSRTTMREIFKLSSKLAIDSKEGDLSKLLKASDFYSDGSNMEFVIYDGNKPKHYLFTYKLFRLTFVDVEYERNSAVEVASHDSSYYDIFRFNDVMVILLRKRISNLRKELIPNEAFFKNREKQD